MSTFWSIWVIVLTLANLALVAWILFANRRVAVSDQEDPENRTTGHVYDGIEEYDNPLPRWWFLLFVATLVFTGIYLAIYPGLGNFKGFSGWTSVGQLENEEAKAREQFDETFGRYVEMSVEEIADNREALKMGARIFANNCAVCHGADGGGNYGFPNLTDNDWLYGGSPEDILKTIHDGRQGTMPPQGAVIGEEGVRNAAEYVLALNGLEHDTAMAAEGQKIFGAVCHVCHGADGKGNQAMGAPNLTNNIWLYGGSREQIQHTVRSGRSNEMPKQEDKLREDKIKLVAGYVYSLSRQEEVQQ
ncbi:cytochrome-c oxidase, cbb3-type subunit III [Microbulbifer sp.]|uniref:cytochrome-c oxidase, cbb3-type subunit III n=1 Tax=Microbulbifer sp. TaxID=1908541 RepID=UPI003F3D6ECD